MMCCGKDMMEVESSFMNDAGEYEPIGYKCNVCGRIIDTNGKEIT